MRKKSFSFILIILLAAVFVLLYASPAFMKITDLDYAIFQYAGQEIDQGKLPYVDFFDHKPPGMFYLNALALFLFNGSRWGIWVFEVIALSAGSLLCFFFLKKYFGKLPAYIATLAFIFNLTYFHQGGNLTEEFALPLQFAILFSLSKWADGKKVGLNAYLIGVFAGIASSYKQPLGGILVGATVFILVQFLTDKDRKRFLLSALYIFAGLVTVWGAWVIYFSLEGILAQFWEGAFVFNFAYSNLSTINRIETFRDVIVELFKKSPYFMISLISYLVCIPAAILSSKAVFKNLSNKWIAALFFLFAGLGIYNGLFRRGLTFYTVEQIGVRQIAEIVIGVGLAVLGWAWVKTSLTEKLRKFLDAHLSVSYEQISLPLIVCLVDLPVQLVMISLSGRSFGHYFMSSLPAMSILCAMFIWFLINKLEDPMRFVWVGVFLIPLIVPPFSTIIEKTKFSEDQKVKQISDYVSDHTNDGDDIFIWDNRVSVYIESERECSSAYFFVSPLFLDGYNNLYHSSRLLKDFQENPAQMVIESYNIKRAFFHVDDPARCATLLDRDELMEMSREKYNTEVFVPEGMPEVYEWICMNYTRVEPTSDDPIPEGMQIYQYTPNRK